MKAFIAALIVFTSLVPAYADLTRRQIEDQTLVILRDNGLNPQNINVSSPGNPIVHVAEALIDLVSDEANEFREVHFTENYGQIPMVFNCLITIKDNKVVQVFRCKAKMIDDRGVRLD